MSRNLKNDWEFASARGLTQRDLGSNSIPAAVKYALGSFPSGRARSASMLQPHRSPSLEPKGQASGSLEAALLRGGGGRTLLVFSLFAFSSPSPYVGSNPPPDPACARTLAWANFMAKSHGPELESHLDPTQRDAGPVAQACLYHSTCLLAARSSQLAARGWGAGSACPGAALRPAAAPPSPPPPSTPRTRCV